jgi:hypothetical protein
MDGTRRLPQVGHIFLITIIAFHFLVQMLSAVRTMIRTMCEVSRNLLARIVVTIDVLVDGHCFAANVAFSVE